MKNTILLIAGLVITLLFLILSTPIFENLGVAAVLAPTINYIYPNSIFSGDGLDFSAQLFSFCVMDFVVEAVLFIIASFSIRWWSSNCRHTPIPE